MFRRRRPADTDPWAEVDPGAVPARFAPDVAAALAARRRFGDIVSKARPGPVRDRLVGLAATLDEGVLAVWGTVRQAGEVEDVLALLGPERVTDEYKRARRSGAGNELEEALAQRFASVQRLLNALDDTEARLRLLDARLGAVVARAAEVVLMVTPDVDALDDELREMVAELTALQAGLTEVRTTSA